MDVKDLDFLIEESSNSVERWTDLAFKALDRSFDLQTRNADRWFNLVLSITTISTAFFTIVAPLKSTPSETLTFTTYLFLSTSILGIIILVATIKRDERLIIDDGIWEHGVMQGYLVQSLDMREKLYEYKKSPSPTLLAEIESTAEIYFGSRKGLDTEAEQRKKKKQGEPSAVLLKKLRRIFWTLLCLSYVFLIIWLR
jgi:hypothetical protein